MGNFQKYWSQNVGQDFIVLDFFHGQKILKVDGRDPQNQEKNAPAGRFTYIRVNVRRTGGLPQVLLILISLNVNE
jgi:hypothetical protein